MSDEDPVMLPLTKAEARRLLEAVRDVLARAEDRRRTGSLAAVERKLTRITSDLWTPEQLGHWGGRVRS